MPKNKTETRVFWSEYERKLVVEDAARRLLQTYLEGRRLPKIEALMMAQRAKLPENRQRSKDSLTASPNITAELGQLIEKLRAEANADGLSAIEASSFLDKNDLPKPVVQSAQTIDGLIKDLIKSAVQEALQPIIDKLGRLEAFLSAQKSQISSESVSHHLVEQQPDLPKPNKQRLPVVLVIGLLPGQQQIVSNALKDSVDVRYVSSDMSARNFHQSIAYREHIFVMTKFVSHTSTDWLPREKSTLVHGGLRNLIDQITDWYLNR